MQFKKKYYRKKFRSRMSVRVSAINQLIHNNDKEEIEGMIEYG